MLSLDSLIHFLKGNPQVFSFDGQPDDTEYRPVPPNNAVAKVRRCQVSSSKGARGRNKHRVAGGAKVDTPRVSPLGKLCQVAVDVPYGAPVGYGATTFTYKHKAPRYVSPDASQSKQTDIRLFFMP